VLQRLPLDAAQPWQCALISESGAPAGDIADGTGPIIISAPSRLALPFTPVQGWPGLSQIEVRLLAADGKILDRLRFAEKPSFLPVTDDQEVPGAR